MSTPAKPLFLVHRNGLSGYIDVSGRVVIPPSFPDAQRFEEELAAVHTGRQFPMRSTESKWGYIDATGQYAIRPQYQMPRIITGQIDIHFSEGLAAAANGKQCGYIDKSGEYRIDPRFDGCSAFHNGLAVVQQKSRYGCIDTKGELRVSFQPHLLFGFREGRAPILVDGKYGFIDEAGVPVIPAVWSGDSIHPSAYGFHEGLAAVESEAGVGFLDAEGTMMIPPRPVRSGEFTQQLDGFLFSEGLAAFPVQGSWGYVDRSGAFSIQPAYDAVGAFREGLAAVYSDGLWKYIDAHGVVQFKVPDQERGRQAFPGGSSMRCGPFKHGLAPNTFVERTSGSLRPSAT